MKLRACIVVILGLVLVPSHPALADIISLTFNIASPIFQPPTSPPWAYLTLTLQANSSITGSFIMAPGQAFLTDVLCFNVVGSTSGFTVTGLPSGWFGAASSSTECGSSFGAFNAEIDNLNGTNQSTLNFDISRTGGFSSVFNLIELSPAGSNCCGAPNVDWQTSLFEANGNLGGLVGAAVPEPGTILLLGSGILGMAGTLRRKLR